MGASSVERPTVPRGAKPTMKKMTRTFVVRYDKTQRDRLRTAEPAILTDDLDFRIRMNKAKRHCWRRYLLRVTIRRTCVLFISPSRRPPRIAVSPNVTTLGVSDVDREGTATLRLPCEYAEVTSLQRVQARLYLRCRCEVLSSGRMRMFIELSECPPEDRGEPGILRPWFIGSEWTPDLLSRKSSVKTVL